MIEAALALALLGPSGIPDGMPEGGFFCRAFEGELKGSAFSFVHAGGGLGVLEAETLLSEGWVGPYMERQERLDSDIKNKLDFTTEIDGREIKVSVMQTIPHTDPEKPVFSFQIEEWSQGSETLAIIGAGPCNYSELPTES